MDMNLPTSERRRRFNKLLLESIYESINFAETIVHFMELRTSLSREELVERPNLFVRELEDLLGEGAKAIEKQIIKNLYTKLGIRIYELDLDSINFEACIRYALKVYLSIYERK